MIYNLIGIFIIAIFIYILNKLLTIGDGFSIGADNHWWWCEKGTHKCIQDLDPNKKEPGTAAHQTEIACKKECTDKYTCNGFVCNKDPDSKKSIDECKKDCGYFYCHDKATHKCIRNVPKPGDNNPIKHVSEESCITGECTNKYSCNGGKCGLDSNSKMTIDECDKVCNYWYCSNDWKCEQDATWENRGKNKFHRTPHDGIINCNTACRKWKCDEIKHTCSREGDGTHEDQNSCQNKCVDKYKCEGGKCIMDPNSPDNKQQCQVKCSDRYICDKTTFTCKQIRTAKRQL